MRVPLLLFSDILVVLYHTQGYFIPLASPPGSFTTVIDTTDPPKTTAPFLAALYNRDPPLFTMIRHQWCSEQSLGLLHSRPGISPFQFTTVQQRPN